MHKIKKYCYVSLLIVHKTKSKPYSNHVTSSKRADTPICHMTMDRHPIHLLYNPYSRSCDPLMFASISGGLCWRSRCTKEHERASVELFVIPVCHTSLKTVITHYRGIVRTLTSHSRANQGTSSDYWGIEELSWTGVNHYKYKIPFTECRTPPGDTLTLKRLAAQGTNVTEPKFVHAYPLWRIHKKTATHMERLTDTLDIGNTPSWWVKTVDKSPHNACFTWESCSVSKFSLWSNCSDWNVLEPQIPSMGYH